MGYIRKYSENDRIYHRELIWQNAYNLFNLYNDEKISDKCIINSQKQFINKFDFSKGRNKYHSIKLLEQYIKTKNKELAKQTFLNHIIKKIKLD